MAVKIQFISFFFRGGDEVQMTVYWIYFTTSHISVSNVNNDLMLLESKSELVEQVFRLERSVFQSCKEKKAGSIMTVFYPNFTCLS